MLRCREWLSSFERKFACGVRPVALPRLPRADRWVGC